MRNGEMKLLNMSIYDYLVLNHKYFTNYGVCYKLSGAITCKQVALGVGLGYETHHGMLMKYVIKKIGPGDSNYSVRFDYDAVKLFAYDYHFIINLPNHISYQQYRVIEDIIEQIRKFEKDYNIKIHTYPGLEEVLLCAKRKFNDRVYIERGEKIVGMPINEQYLIDSIKEKLEIEKCNNIKYFRRAVKILLKYYHDSFFKDVIVKMFSDAEYYDNIFNKLLKAYEKFDKQIVEEEYQFLVENVSQKRFEWKKNSSSYDLYLYYKNSIRDRLEFEKIREEFDKILCNQIKEKNK